MDLKKPTTIIKSVVIGDLTRLKSLRVLEVWVELENLQELLPEGSTPHDFVVLCSSPFLVGLVCEILSQVPVDIEVVWLSWLREWPEWHFNDLNEELEYIAHKFSAIKGCDRATST